mgnify:CR=1 FL=1
MKKISLIWILACALLFTWCTKTVETPVGLAYESNLVIVWVWPEQGKEPTVDEWTLVLRWDFEDHSDHVFLAKWIWESYFNEDISDLEWRTVTLKWIVEELDWAAGNHYYNVQSINTLGLVNHYQEYEWILFVAWVWPEQSGEPTVNEWTLVLRWNFEDHTDHLFINEWWENYLWNESIIPWSAVAFKWTVEEIDAWAWNHYYDVKWFEELSFIYNEADTCNLDNDCLPENWFWNDILAELDNCNVTSVFQTHSLKVWATTKDWNTFESVEPEIDAIVKAAQAASEKCGYEIMIATE